MSQPESAPRRSRRVRNIALIALGLCLLVGFIGSLASRNGSQSAPTPRTRSEAVAAVTQPPEPTATPRPTRTPPPTATPQPTPTPVPTVAPQDLRGTGQRVVKVQLAPGLAVFAMKHTGKSNFAITLLESSGDPIDLLVNEIGSFTGSTAVAIPEAATYVLNVDADGPWQIHITQPRPDTAAVDQPPVKLEGKGAAVSQFLRLSGLVTFTAKHTGRSNFAITVLHDDGRPADLIVNEIGNYDGSQASRFTAGEYILKIAADGPWTISIE